MRSCYLIVLKEFFLILDGIEYPAEVRDLGATLKSVIDRTLPSEVVSPYPGGFFAIWNDKVYLSVSELSKLSDLTDQAKVTLKIGNN
jgi:hypothetical protein